MTLAEMKIKLKELSDASTAIRDATAVECTCTGFALQYEGCTCGRREGINKAEDALRKGAGLI